MKYTPEMLEQKLQGAEARKAIIEALIKKMDQLGPLLSPPEFTYVRDLVANQWGQENELIRITSDLMIDSL